MTEPLEPAAAKALIRTILEAGTVTFSRHALEELGKDELTTVDAVNALRGGVVGPGELERGTWPVSGSHRAAGRGDRVSLRGRAGCRDGMEG